MVSLLYALFGFRRRIELTEKARELDEKEREFAERANELAKLKAEKELKEQQKAKLAEPILDENANIMGDYEDPYKNATS